ncbi:hypothetical protein K505DRAFT_361477 [Melanomma pulvis-pyrius CBS 109.77]|uniref:Uncharacterized protein n=1 Tax=Melanomma pulvis-pyrius CBS 109.77 TaxID=1314802 RepID=A0A6A6XE95_9PLEO|nr:hypothetical protein K505DRAFT_361477 [Melanomma pulvis-pyrius CBS 109.77]
MGIRHPSPFFDYRGPIVIVDERHSWHTSYPTSPVPPSSSFPARNPHKYPHFYPFPPSPAPAPSPHHAHAYGQYSDNIHPYHSPTYPRPYHNPPGVFRYMDGRQNVYDSNTNREESEFSRRMRIAREVAVEMAREEELKMKAEAEREQARRAALQELHKARYADARSNRPNETHRQEQMRGRERIHGLGLHGKESSRRAWEPRPKPKMESGRRAPAQNPHPRTEKDHVDWKLEMYPRERRSGHAEQDHRAAGRPERWVEAREKGGGDVEVVMVRRGRRRGGK